MHCILHIGTEKTGTTLLQNWLYANKDALSRQGVALTQKGGAPNNRKLCAYCQNHLDDFTRNMAIYDEKERQRFFRHFAREIQDEILALQSSGHRSFIFTSEHFHSRLRSIEEIENLRKLLSPMFEKFTVICYFREQSQVRTSLYSTSLKINGTKTIEEFQSEISPNDHYYNYMDFFKKWESVFGRESLTPRLFEKGHLVDHDIRVDFIKSTLPDLNIGSLDFDIESSNESLSHDTAVILREINKARPNFVGKFPDPTPGSVKAVIQSSSILKSQRKILDPRQRKTYEDFEESNLEFFARFFGERKNLFKAPESPSARNNEVKTLDIYGAASIIASILSIKGLIKISESEIDFIRDLAINLHREGKIANKEALMLLKLASRARPHGGFILSKIDELRKM